MSLFFERLDFFAPKKFQRAKVHVRHAAVVGSDVLPRRAADISANVSVLYPDLPLGFERGSANESSTESFEQDTEACRRDATHHMVNALTLDEAFWGSATGRGAPSSDALRHRFVDVVLVDTQTGTDIEAVLGMRAHVEAGAIGLIVFHNSRKPTEDALRRSDWKIGRMLDVLVMDLMDPNGFQCFHLTAHDATGGLFTSISGACWKPKVSDIVGWFNTACFNMRLPYVREAVLELIADHSPVADPRPHCDFRLLSA